MQSLILVLHMLFSLSLIGLVLMQHGKGADIGASFGSGASNTMFGSQGSTPFLVKLTALVAGLFITTSLILGYMAYRAGPAVGESAVGSYEKALDSVASDLAMPLTEESSKTSDNHS